MSEPTVTEVDVEELELHPENARTHRLDAIAQSLEANGQYRAIVANRRNGRILAGNGTYRAAVELLEWDRIRVEWVDVDEATERRILAVDNRANDLAGYDDAALRELLTAIAHDDPELVGTGFTAGELAALTDAAAASDARDELDATDPATVGGDDRMSRVALHFTLNPRGRHPDEARRPYVSNCAGVLCCAAIWCGWGYGTRSSNRACLAAETWDEHRPTFVDNDFHDYDHERHLDVVAHWRPRYATAFDVMSREQAQALGIRHVELAEIIDQADELAEHADDVIVIPKTGDPDAIPDRFVLGYSIPTSYGGTPLPLEAFRGRRVHLLGGSPRRQLAAWHALSDEVESLDTNYLFRTALWGRAFQPDGTTSAISDANGLPQHSTSSSLTVASVISLASFARRFQRDPVTLDAHAAEQLEDAADLDPDGDPDAELADA